MSKKKKGVSQIEITMDGKPASLLDVAENNPDGAVWKSFLERWGLQGTDSARRYLELTVGEHLTAGEASKTTGISARILDKWRKEGRVEAEMLKGRWHYSLQSVANAIKTADIKDLK